MAGTNTTVTTPAEVSSGIITTTNTFVDTTTFTDDLDQVEVLNYDGADWLYVTVDSTAPTVGGKNTYPIPPVVGAGLVLTVGTSGNTVVKVIAATATKYIVTRAVP